jgi:hypothetical protein
VFGVLAFLQDLAVDALSIIANPQREELAVVDDLGVDAARARRHTIPMAAHIRNAEHRRANGLCSGPGRRVSAGVLPIAH